MEAFSNIKMSQLTFKFPFKKNYLKREFFVSSNNFEVYKLIEAYPNWPDKWINIYGSKGCGKTHLANILKDKASINYYNPAQIKNETLKNLNNCNFIIIDNYNHDIEENLMYTFLNHSKQLNNYLLITSPIPLSKMKIKLKDLKSRLSSFIEVGIGLPTDDLLRVIISKSFSENQIELSVRNLEFIIKNIDRSYEKIFTFIKEIDKVSLSSGKSININLIKKVLNK